MIYFDNAATTVIKPESVYRAADNAMRRLGNPGRGGHSFSMKAADTAYQCRERLCRLFGCDDSEKIIFTFNATHGLNIAINSLVEKGDNVLVTGFEHNAVMRPLISLGANIDYFGNKLFDQEYTVSSLKSKIGKDTKCVIANHVSNVFGFIQPIYEISEICHKYGVPFIIDASQSAGVIKIDQNRLNADFIAMPGHKGLYGPQGTGVLICNHTSKPLLYGGTGSVSESFDMPDFLPDRLEAGTGNTPGIAGLSEGVQFILNKGTDRIFNHELKLKNALKSRLDKMPYISAVFDNSLSCQTGVISLNMQSVPCEELASKLGSKGVAVRAGLHCAPAAHTSAGTIKTGTVRVSFSAFNSVEEIYKFVNILEFIHSFG